MYIVKHENLQNKDRTAAQLFFYSSRREHKALFRVCVSVYTNYIVLRHSVTHELFDLSGNLSVSRLQLLLGKRSWQVFTDSRAQSKHTRVQLGIPLDTCTFKAAILEYTRTPPAYTQQHAA